MPDRTDPSRRATRRPVTDRWAFKPLALLLLVPLILAAAGLTAIVIAPPFIGAGLGVRELDRRLDAAGADFTKIPRFPQRSTIYANDGTTVLAHVYLANREIVPLTDISQITRKAVLGIEDSTFYEHGALNVTSMFRALIENLRAGGIVQGGSTITQQLVKNTLGLDPYDQSVERKFQEAALAMKVEQKYPKNRILGMYLNQVYLGNNVYGIGTAAKFYFHEPASELTLTEGATLAGMLRAPAKYDPVAHPTRSRVRRNDVLNAMMRLGWLSAAKNKWAKKQPLGLAAHIGELELPIPPFLVTYMRQQIVDDPHGWYHVLGTTREERERALLEGGLDIVTTLDPQWQAAAQRAANAPWASPPYHPEHEPPADVGIVSVDVETGAIRTMLSGKHYHQDRVNTVTTAHQPGSSFKPYILATAFEQGIPPSDTFSGVQGTISDPRCTTNGAPWVVINAEGSSRGYMNLWDATTESVNAVFAHLILEVGPDNVAAMAQRMGVESPLQAVCSLATGSVGISPLDQASGYQTLANGGIHCYPYAVAEIRRRDQVLFRHRPDCHRVLTKTIANLETQLLLGPVSQPGGTATSVFSTWSPWQLAGKTGTSDLNQNVWFVGYTRQVATAVWVGSQGRPYPLQDYWGYSVFGGSVAAPIWRAYMEQVMQGMPALRFPEPTLLQVPSVVGKTEDEARTILRDAKLRVATLTIGSYLPAGTVAAQSPSGGSETLPGAVVTISISNGVPPVSTVPHVYGLSQAAATAALQAAHFFVSVVPEEITDPALAGIVLRQDPKGGVTAEQGSTVTIYVGVAPIEPPPPGNGGGGGGGNGGGGGQGQGH